MLRQLYPELYGRKESGMSTIAAGRTRKLALGVFFTISGVAMGADLTSRAPITYTKDIAPILQEKCQDCHRPNQVAPFALLTYEQARKRSADLAHVTPERIMPRRRLQTSVDRARCLD